MIQQSSNARSELIFLLETFVDHQIDAKTFVSKYQESWRKWRDSRELYELNKTYSDAFDRAFTASDCYAGDGDLRNEWNIGDNMLHDEISEILKAVEGSDHSA